MKERLWRHNFCQWRHLQNLSLASNHIADIVMWPKITKSSISNFYERRRHNFYNSLRILPEKPFFLEVVLVQVKQFVTGTRYGLEILQKCDKRIETKNQKVLRTDSYIFSEATGSGVFLPINNGCYWIWYYFKNNHLLSKHVFFQTK